MHAVEWRKREVTVDLSFFFSQYIISNGQSFFGPHVNDTSNRRASYWKWQFILRGPEPEKFQAQVHDIFILKHNVFFPYHFQQNMSRPGRAWTNEIATTSPLFAHFILATTWIGNLSNASLTIFQWLWSDFICHWQKNLKFTKKIQ